MPASQLWAISSIGRVFTLSTNEQSWKEVRYRGLEFKRVSPSSFFTWAIGGDHLVYVYIPLLDIPIRYREVTYENERWNPYSGFTAKLLPTDRSHWSSEDGRTALPKESFELPSLSWQWEDDWRIEDSLDGQPLGYEGWTYSVDFPASFGPSKKWNSMVRRRKWVRYRRFVAMDSWTLVPSIHSDPVTEPFLDVSVGGNDIPGGDNETFAVWAVTIMGRVMFRQGVTVISPEGVRWDHVATPCGCEVNQISVGPTGLVWAVSWDGSALVRIGVNRRNIMGADWKIVESPGENNHLQQVSVGNNAVWAVSRNGKVWFRKGVKGGQAGDNVNSATGNGWVEMVGELSMVSVGPNDQVWSLGYEDRMIYFRTGVVQAELSGKMWKPILLSLYPAISKKNSVSSTASHGSIQSKYDGSESYADSVSSSTPEMTPRLADRKTVTITEPSITGSVTIASPLKIIYTSASKSKPAPSESDSGVYSAEATTDDKAPNVNTQHSLSDQSSLSSDASDTVIDFVHSVSDQDDIDESDMIDTNVFERTSEVRCDSNMNEALHHSGNIENYNNSSAAEVFDSQSKLSSDEEEDCQSIMTMEGDISRKTSYSADLPNEVWPSTMTDDNSQSLMVYETTSGNFSWSWLSGSGCIVDPQSLPQWFAIETSSFNFALDEPWRLALLSQFRQRREKLTGFKSYPQAIEKSTWIKTGSCHIWAETQPRHWVDCHLELERCSSGQTLDSGILTCIYFLGQKRKLVINLVEVTCLVNTSGKLKYAIAIYTAHRTTTQNPVKLAFPSDNEMEDWLATLCLASCDLWTATGRPDNEAVWSTTVRGDVYVHDSSADLNDKLPSYKMWRLLGGGHLNIVETCSAGVVWGIGYNNTAWVYTSGYGGGLFKGISGCNSGIHRMTDTRHIYVYENQRWNPLTGFSARRLPTDRYMWSDKTGQCECTKENMQLPSIHWQWLSDWAVDFRTPGGVDTEGWQYATDFPYSYHSSKTFTDYVRRRRWFRKCKLNTTGPWQELGSTPLIDLSLQVDHSGNTNEVIAAWAVATNGDALCRMGVTALCPKGTHWVHVPAHQPFQSISVGGDYKVWAIARDGSAFLRNGVTAQNQTGQIWFHVEAPQYSLCQISAGKSSVFAVDENKNLWYRQEIVPMFPEGTSWKMVCGNIRMVSVGPDDQVWAVSEMSETPGGCISGMVCCREGITDKNKIGTAWQLGIGGGWQYVSIRGTPAAQSVETPVSFEGTKNFSVSSRENTVLG